MSFPAPPCPFGTYAPLPSTRSIYLAYANTCPTDIRGNKRPSTGQTFKGITMYTSIDGGNSFLQGCLPVAIKQEGYELLSTQDGTGAIVIVDFLINNGYMDIPASSVYTAGPHHALFSLSLTDVYRADFGFSTDFARIEGLPVRGGGGEGLQVTGA